MPCNNTCLMGDICGDRYGGSQKPPCASKPVELSTTAPNSASDAMQRLCNLVSAGVNNEAFCSAAHRVINDYRAAQRTLP